MNEYYFLFGLAFIWTIFAVVDDLKKREVPNWINFSLIGFALAYRAFYSFFSNDLMFLISGLAGFGVFFALAYGFYYARVFAGGDAKLMMGFGVILPYSNFIELFYFGVMFIFVLFLFGSIYSMIYSIFIVAKHFNKFSNAFKNILKKFYLIFTALFSICIITFVFDWYFGILLFVLTILLPLLYFYVGILNECVTKLVNAKDLQEGDWLENDVRIGRIVIKKNFQGLSLKDIKLLIKAKKKVTIREGIPFTPAFLISLIAMAPFFLALRFDLVGFLMEFLF